MESNESIEQQSCWERRSIMQRFIIVNISALLMVTVIVVVIVSLVLVSKRNEYCLSSDCMRTASEILSKMQVELNPCNDFYKFACGKFMENAHIPEEAPSLVTAFIINAKVKRDLKDLITLDMQQNEEKRVSLPKILYRSCMNTEKINLLKDDLMRKLSATLGDWPVVKGADWNMPSNWTWQQTIKDLHRLGFKTNHLFTLSVVPDEKNNSRNILQLSEPEFKINRAYLVKGFKEIFIVAYYKYMMDVAAFYGANHEDATFQLGEALHFEMQLANLTMSPEELLNEQSQYSMHSIAQLQQMYPYVDWMSYINALLPDSLQVDENEQVIVKQSQFFEALNPLLNQTANKVLANFLLWRAHHFAMSFLSEKFQLRQFEFQKVLEGTQDRQPRWLECVNRVIESFPIAVSSVYVEKHFSNHSRAEVTNIVENIRSAFHDIIEELYWIDAETKRRALDKLAAVVPYVGYNDDILNATKLAAYYAPLELHEDEYFQNILHITKFHAHYDMGLLRQAVDKTYWKKSAVFVHAHYNKNLNNIELPAGMLQQHYFSAARPNYLNYGAIGFIIGHEFTHGFDEEGSQFDAEGNLLNWWQPDTRMAFHRKSQCIANQYAQYRDAAIGLKLNGNKTLNENLADNGGYTLAYYAYKNWRSKYDREPTLPGLDYTSAQMFWISAAQNFCAKLRKEYHKMLINTDAHSPPEFRVLGPLVNSYEFSEDFKCEVETPMNPAKKCRFWS